MRFTQVDLLDKVAPSDRGWRRHVVAARPAARPGRGVVAIARPVDHDTERTDERGSHPRAVRRVAVDGGRRRRSRPASTPPRRRRATSSTRSTDDVEVGLISFSRPGRRRGRPDARPRRAGRRDRQPRARRVDGDRRRAGRRQPTARPPPATTRTSTTSPPAPSCCSPTARRPSGATTDDGAAEAAEAGIPVFTIAFGTDDGIDRRPGQRRDRAGAGEAGRPRTGRRDDRWRRRTSAATATSSPTPTTDIQDGLGETLGDEIEIVNELTWQWASPPSCCSSPPGRSPLVAPRHGLTPGSGTERFIRTEVVRRCLAPMHHLGQLEQVAECSMVSTGSLPTG